MKQELQKDVKMALPLGVLAAVVFVGTFVFLGVFGIAALGVAWMLGTLFGGRRR